MKKEYEIPLTKVVYLWIDYNILSSNPVEGGIEGMDDDEFNF
jgi:hypothetical protein